MCVKFCVVCGWPFSTELPGKTLNTETCSDECEVIYERRLLREQIADDNYRHAVGD